MYNQEYARAYYKKHRTKILAQTKAYAKSHPEIRAKIARTFAQKHKTSPKEQTRQLLKHIIQRCTDPSHRNFKYYGGRGVKVCLRWRHFPNFVADMGYRPPGMTIERISNDKGYEPGNCRWATWNEQYRNRRNNRFLTYFGLRLILSDVAKVMGVGNSTLLQWVNLHPEFNGDFSTLFVGRRGKLKSIQLPVK